MNEEKIITNYHNSLKSFDQNDKSRIWESIQLKRFNEINEEKLKNFRNNGLSRGMDNDFLKLKEPLNFKKYNEKLIFHNTSFVELKKYLTKKNLGNSKNLLNIEGYYVGVANFKNLERIRDLNEFCFSKNKINLICEIGGGFGLLAKMIMLEQTNLKYFLIDLPETNLLSHYYLSNTFPDKKFFTHTQCKENTISESDLENHDIFILNPWVSYKNIRFDLFINAQSMMEMKNKIVKKYFDFIHSHISNNGFFYNINRLYHDGSGERNLLSEYPYDDFWNVVISKSYKTSVRSHIFLCQRSSTNNTNFKVKIKEIKELEKNFTTINVPLSLIYFYRKCKNFVKKLIKK
tara:strand:+ start:812 stop:1852 length:1041 start_codon:yes stop_codon:yes gene_type:complete